MTSGSNTNNTSNNLIGGLVPGGGGAGVSSGGLHHHNNHHHHHHPHDTDVDTLLLTTCWSQANPNNNNEYLLDTQKLILDNSDLETNNNNSTDDQNDLATKVTMDALDSLLLNSTGSGGSGNNNNASSNLAELKPLPPFTGYTANLSINGIQGHHYHAIAQHHQARLLSSEENNNSTTIITTTSPQSPNCGTISSRKSGNNNGNYNSHNNNNNNAFSSNEHNNHNIVSSSTCINVAADCTSAALSPPDSTVINIKSMNDQHNLASLYHPQQHSSASGGVLVDECVDSVSGGVKLEYSDCMVVADSCCVVESAGNNHVKNEMNEYDISSIEDIAAIIGSAIADTTVPNNNHHQLDCGHDPQHCDPNCGDSRDSWMDLDAWIDGACVEPQKNMIISQDGMSEFILPHSPQQQLNNNSSTLQSLLTHGYMPLLQNRLQNGPPPAVKQEAPSSTSYGGVDLISTSSPPANVVSTTDSVMLNGRYIQQQYGNVLSGLQDDRIRSPDLLNYPHTTTTHTPSIPKKQRNRSQKKAHQSAAAAAAVAHQATSSSNNNSTSSSVFTSEQSLSLLGKEKPVHRCHICNRGFLNKSNIKVHLRTHTGEKPFRCETCAKAFRQKAHLIKHQQIHKRIGRD
ncbi:ichor [Chrysoperla carnea]|uniref:ichor n=1 Tax=Chrysoperla carnea TaxID=189513 RepID=UPI001D096222|nr:ichor [Chrysoperla carnea]